MPQAYTRPLSIIVGQGGPYERVATPELGRLSRILLVEIRNNSANYIGNCTFYLDHFRSDSSLRTIQLSGVFDLLPKKERYIQVASYTGAAQTGVKADSIINLCMTPDGLPQYKDLLTIENRHIITLRVESPDNFMDEVKCYLWVDEGGKLRMENVTKEAVISPWESKRKTKKHLIPQELKDFAEAFGEGTRKQFLAALMKEERFSKYRIELSIDKTWFKELQKLRKVPGVHSGGRRYGT